jgi:hypothetical protein
VNRIAGVGIHTKEHRTTDGTSVRKGMDARVGYEPADFLEVGFA